MGEADEKPKKSGVPSWQLKPAMDASDAKGESNETRSQTTPSRASIVEKARRFLEEDEVRNAPTDKQVAFLESKGLESHEIEDLLGVTRNTEASSKPESKPSPDTPIEPSSPPTSQPMPLPSQPSSPTVASTQVVRDVPPIITYPEFLVTPTQPAPFITARRLLTTLYLFGGVSALLYGTTNYLVTPMVASLTSSRHEFVETAQNNLDRLIARLRGMVSENPDVPTATKEIEYEDEDSDSDPTELFHRDIGVQTSLPPSPSPSRPASPSLPTDLSTSQTLQLNKISGHIKGVNEAFISEGQESSNLTTTVNILREYLDSLAYVPQTFTYGTNRTYNSGLTNAVDDEISKVKAQIRGVKGVLLSARSFPGGAAQARVR